MMTKRNKIIVKDYKKDSHFRHDHEQLFWNLIFYMSNYGLPYDMFLPYKETKQIDDTERGFEMNNEHCFIEFSPESNIQKVLAKKSSKPSNLEKKISAMNIKNE